MKRVALLGLVLAAIGVQAGAKVVMNDPNQVSCSQNGTADGYYVMFISYNSVRLFESRAEELVRANQLVQICVNAKLDALSENAGLAFDPALYPTDENFFSMVNGTTTNSLLKRVESLESRVTALEKK